jgi:N-methylhydantoinase B
VQPGDVLEVHTGGGGGFGQPFERDAEQVALEVRRGFVSSVAARDDYGVAVTADGELDEAETRLLRDVSD